MREAIRNGTRGLCGRSHSLALATREACLRCAHSHPVEACSCQSSTAARFDWHACHQVLDWTEEGSVVETALLLCAEEPLQPPLSILDRAMARFGAHDLDFAFDADELRLPHPFAKLIWRAFAPQRSPGTSSVASTKATLGDAGRRGLPSEVLHADWARIIMCFADRYGLWLPLEFEEDDDSNAIGG
jgi:hypothetical protein